MPLAMDSGGHRVSCFPHLTLALSSSIPCSPSISRSPLTLTLLTHLSSFFFCSLERIATPLPVPVCPILRTKKNERATTTNNRRLDSVRLLFVAAPNLPSCSPPFFAYSVCSLCLRLS